VQAQGEVAVLKDTINEMIVNLKDTTEKNTEQDWLKTNLAKFSRMLQGQRDLNTVGRLILSDLAPVVKAQHAMFFVLDSSREPNELALLASYAAEGRAKHGKRLQLGEGLIGQCALEKQKILLVARAERLLPHQLGARRGRAALAAGAADRVRRARSRACSSSRPSKASAPRTRRSSSS
jgi:hypothetical protein